MRAGRFVVGWFHTHPNSLPAFMSGTDRATQRSFFSAGWHFALGLNPHRRLAACFHAADADPCALAPQDFADEA